MKNFKNYALLLLVAIMALATSCGEDYDDTAIKKDISDLQSRVEKLEEWCKTANKQITSLQSLVSTMQANDYVTGVTPVMEGTTEVGYTISFTKSKPITIMHGTNGTNGKDGTTPVIGVKKHTDNLYYWTIQTGSGEATWMKDADGKMIPTTGKDGAAGQKPVISVAKDGDRYYWQIDGQWLTDAAGQKVPATGDKGDTGAAGSNGTNGSNGAPGEKGDSFFDSVTPDTAKGTVVIKLANGTEFTLPMLSTTVSFDDYNPLQITATGTETAVVVKLPATLKKVDFAAIKADITNVVGTNSDITRAAPTEKWTVAVTAPTFKTDGTLDAQPTVKVTVPANAPQDETALLEVTVIDTKGNKSTSTRVLYYDNRIAVTGVTIAPTTATVKVGRTETLTHTIVPANATTQTVTWTSSDEAVATVVGGVVTGEKAGSATITVTTTDGGFTATCAVTVENIAVTGITLTDATLSLKEKKILTATITPTDATVKTVTWSSSNTAVATVNATTGEVEGVAAGEAMITATWSEDSNIKGTCKVTVTEKKSITWATGNLVANGTHGAKIGQPTDGGLYFQFGSLIGWSGGASGDGTGTPTNGLALTAKVTPSNYQGSTLWDSSWTGDPGVTSEASGVGDPCKYYLKDSWRLPTNDEYVELFKNSGYPSTGPWKWDDTSNSATNNKLSLSFPASAYRSSNSGNLYDVGANGSYWSASPISAGSGYSLGFSGSSVDSSDYGSQALGFAVRCVQEK